MPIVRFECDMDFEGSWSECFEHLKRQFKNRDDSPYRYFWKIDNEVDFFINETAPLEWLDYFKDEQSLYQFFRRLAEPS